MTIKKKQNKGGVTRSQLALIGVLVVVLVGVIVVQLPDASAPPLASAKGDSTQLSVQSIFGSTNQEEEEAQEQRAARKWPKFSSQQLGRLDPLSTPDWYKSILEVVEKKQDSEKVTEVAHDIELKEMQDTGTAIVLIAGPQRIAKVGDSRVRVGDKIDGYEVSNITSEGVILTKSKSR